MKTAALQKGEETLIECVELASRLSERMKGLLGRQSLGTNRGMYLSPCGSIHTFRMRFTLDLIFLDCDMRVCRIVREVLPNRMVLGGSKACSVVETETGWFPEDALKVGDRVSLL